MKKLSAVILSASLFLPTLPVSAASFADVPPTKYSWATTAIDTLTEQGIIKGYQDGTFKPSKTVTKKELAILLERIKPGSTYNINPNYLAAEPNKALNRWEVMMLLSEAFPAGKDYTDAEISRSVKSIKDVKKIVAGPNGVFSDSDWTPTLIADEYKNGVYLFWSDFDYSKAVVLTDITSRGFMTANAAGQFFPKQPVTRAEVATILYRAMQTL